MTRAVPWRSGARRAAGGRRRTWPAPACADMRHWGVVVRRFVDVPQEPDLLRASAATSRPPIIAFDHGVPPIPSIRSVATRRRNSCAASMLAAPAELRLTVLRPRPSPELDRLLTRTRGLRVRASSTWGSLPRWRAGNAVDGSARTAWIAQPPAPSAPTLPGSAGRSGAAARVGR